MNAEHASARSRATIRDVASRAGVSKSLVSLVYSSPESVSPARRARVRSAAAELGYRPNHVARSLTGIREDIVGILVADSRNPVFNEIVNAVRSVLLDAGRLGIVLDATAPDAAGAAGATLDLDLLAMLADLRPAGMLIVGSVPDMSRVRGAMPSARVVVASAIPFGLPSAPAVHSDDSQGIELAVRHLVERGHRRIAHIGGAGGATADVRARAFESALTAYDLPALPIGLSDFTERAGFRAADGLLDRRDPPSALVAASDLAAVGALAAVRRRGLDGRVAVTGYDNTYLADLALVGLTSIEPGNREIGKQAAQLLLSGEEDSSEHLIQPRIMIRDSSKFIFVND